MISILLISGGDTNKVEFLSSLAKFELFTVKFFYLSFGLIAALETASVVTVFGITKFGLNIGVVFV